MNKDLEIIVMDNHDHVFFQNRFILIELQKGKIKKEAAGKYWSFKAEFYNYRRTISISISSPKAGRMFNYPNGLP